MVRTLPRHGHTALRTASGGLLVAAALLLGFVTGLAQDGAATPAMADDGFAPNAFPPTLSDTEWHARSWERDDCLRCHETGVQDAPEVLHRGMPDVLLTAKCRTCHVFIPGSEPRPRPEEPPIDAAGFAANAFPPMIPNSVYHKDAWDIPNCLLCHEDGILGAPLVEHVGLPKILMRSKCRTCHVQVRAIESDDPTGH